MMRKKIPIEKTDGLSLEKYKLEKGGLYERKD